MREIMDCIGDRLVERVVIQSSAQIGKTELINNCIGYYIHQDPSPMLVLQPTLDLAQAYSKDRLAPMIRDTEALSKKVRDVKSRDSGNTLLQKKFPGGHITLAGANSPASLASRPIRVVLCDETDRYPISAGTEGSPIKLAQKRATTFFNKKFIEVSTPTIAGRSAIEKSYLTSDQRIYQVPCPLCGEYQDLKFGQLKWEGEEQPENVRYECEHCKECFDDTSKQELLMEGRWQPRAPFTGTAGFQINELYSPWVRWSAIVKAFLEAKTDPEKLKVWVNTSLGETWKAKEGEQVDWQMLYLQREPYQIGVVPEDAAFITAACDVQKDRVECEVVAWCRDKQSYSVEVFQFFGDTSDDQAEPYSKLDELLNQSFFKPSGKEMQIAILGIDTGFNTQTVYNWTRLHHPTRVVALKGRDSLPIMVSQPTQVDIHLGGKKIKRGVRLWSVGTNIIKNELFSWLKIQKPTDEAAPYPPCYCHFPEYGEEYFKQLTAEQVSSKMVAGQKIFYYEKVRERNEALDMRVYNRAVANIYGLDRFNEAQWDALGAPRPAKAQPKPEPEDTQKPAPRPPQAPSPAPIKQQGRPSVKRRSTWL